MGIQEVFIDTEKGQDLERASATLDTSTRDDDCVETPAPPDLGLSPNPKDIESARLLRAEAISTLDLFFRQMESPSPQHLLEIRSVVGTLFDGILEHQAEVWGSWLGPIVVSNTISPP